MKKTNNVKESQLKIIKGYDIQKANNKKSSNPADTVLVLDIPKKKEKKNDIII